MRVFIGVPLPAELRELVARTVDPLRDEAPRLKWVAPELYHLTLQFIGDCDDARYAALTAALPELASRRPFKMRLGGLMTLPKGSRARVYALSLDEGFDELESLARAIFRLTKGLRIPRERRPFKAHLTLARARRGEKIPATLVAEDVILPTQAGWPEWPDWDVDAFHLYESILRPEGPIYRSRLAVELAGA